MATLKNHPGFELRDDAAAAFNAYEDKYGKRTVNSAKRSVADQNALIRRWDKGGKQNRPPYLYPPARPAEASRHVAEGGIAVDIGDWRTFKAHCEEFGFHWWGDGDVVHFEFRGWSGGTSAPAGFSQLVANEQNWLNHARGEKLAVDGIRGPATKAAYKRYQTFLKSIGLYSGAIDGVWGSGTQSGHQRYYDSLHAPTRTGALSYADIQRGLNKFGYGLAVDGIWGRKSSNALADFQSKHGLKVDRLVGPQTRAALGI